MASDLPDALERLALQAEQSEQAETSSLSKYFGQPDSSEDIFDVIAKPSRSEEPKINLVLSPTSSKTKETSNNVPPSFAFKKGDEDSEPKIFSYFSQPPKTQDVSEFFDQISDFTSKPQEMTEAPVIPTELATEALSSQVNPEKADSTSHVTSSEKEAPCPEFKINSIATNEINLQPSEIHTNILANSNFQFKKASSAFERASSWWIPHENLQNRFKNSESYRLTCPGITTNIELNDPIKDLLRNLDGENAAAQRRCLTADHVTQDDQGIEDLIKANCYRAAANLAGRLLTSYGQGYGKSGQQTKHTPYSLKLWCLRISLLYRCRLFDTATTEINAFGDFDSPDLYYEFYPEFSHLKGSMVPFTLRLIAAMLPAQKSQFQEAYSKMCRLLSNVRRIIKEAEKFAARDQLNESESKEAIALWIERENQVEACLVDCAIMRKDYHNAIQLIKKKIARLGNDPGLYTELGRVFLLLGDVNSAQVSFNRAAELRNINNPNDAVASLMNAGMLAISREAFAEAHGHFQKALALQPDHPAVINNTAVCLLYMGCMRDAMLLLEENLGTNPETMIQDYTVLNVCTLYELESSLTAQRKLGMLRLASQWRTDNLDVSSFKLS